MMALFLFSIVMLLQINPPPPKKKKKKKKPQPKKKKKKKKKIECEPYVDILASCLDTYAQMCMIRTEYFFCLFY